MTTNTHPPVLMREGAMGNALSFRWRNQAATDMSDPRGIADYTLPDGQEISLPLPNFTTANALHNALYDAFAHARQDARAGLLSEISRITP